MVSATTGTPDKPPASRDTEAVQHALQHRADADDELEIVEHGGAVQQRRQRIVLEVDDQFAVPGRVGARMRAVAQQPAAIIGEVGELNS